MGVGLSEKLEEGEEAYRITVKIAKSTQMNINYMRILP